MISDFEQSFPVAIKKLILKTKEKRKVNRIN